MDIRGLELGCKRDSALFASASLVRSRVRNDKQNQKQGDRNFARSAIFASWEVHVRSRSSLFFFLKKICRSLVVPFVSS